MEFFKLYWEGVIALLALITSLLSVLISFWTFRLQRTHYIKSVSPIIQIGQWDYENCLCVDLRNGGLGVAIVKKISVHNKTENVKNSVYDWLPKKLTGSMNYKEYWTGYKDFVIQPQQTIKLIEVKLDPSIKEEKEQREALRAVLRQLTIKITYEDIYGNQMEDKSIELYIFSRTDHEN